MDQYLQIIIYILSGILGLCVGSFLNVVIYRLPNNMSRAVPASHCPDCKHPLKWYDNIPVLSYTILGGKCRYCKKHISSDIPQSSCLIWHSGSSQYGDFTVTAACSTLSTSAYLCSSALYS